MVVGYVNSLLECRRDRSVFIDGYPRVYQNTSQFANEIDVSTSCGPVTPVRKPPTPCHEIEGVAPGRSNSCSFLPLRRSCSSSLTSRNREQYFWCSWSAAQCSSEQCVGQPQSGHSNLTGSGWGFVCVWTCSCEEEQTGQGASSLIASPLARIAGNGDFENGWKRSSSLSSGFGSAKCCSLRLKRPKKDRVCRGWASRSERRATRRKFIS